MKWKEKRTNERNKFSRLSYWHSCVFFVWRFVNSNKNSFLVCSFVRLIFFDKFLFYMIFQSIVFVAL